jgi:hypothetical protein
MFAAARALLTSPPPPRANRTRRVPHPVLIGHARAGACSAPSQPNRPATPLPPRVRARRRAGGLSGAGAGAAGTWRASLGPPRGAPRRRAASARQPRWPPRPPPPQPPPLRPVPPPGGDSQTPKHRSLEPLVLYLVYVVRSGNAGMRRDAGRGRAGEEANEKEDAEHDRHEVRPRPRAPAAPPRPPRPRGSGHCAQIQHRFGARQVEDAPGAARRPRAMAVPHRAGRGGRCSSKTGVRCRRPGV